MKFRKTSNDIEAMGRLASDEIGLAEALSMVMNVLMDVRAESGRELNRLDVSSGAVIKWMGVANALLSIPIENEAKSISEKSRSKLPDLRRALEERSGALKDTGEKIELIEKEERRLREKLDEYEKEYSRLRRSEEAVETLKNRITALKTDIDAFRPVDDEELKAEIDRLERIREKKLRREEEWERYNKQLAIETAKLDRLKTQIFNANEVIRNADSELNELELKNNEKETQIAALKSRKTELEDRYTSLCEEEQSVLYGIGIVKDDIKEAVSDRMNAEQELEECETTLKKINAVTDELKLKISEAEIVGRRLEDEQQDLRRNLEDKNNRIADLEKDDADLKTEIAVKEEELNQKIAEKDVEIRGLSEQLTVLENLLTQKEQERSKLYGSKSEADSRLERFREEVKTLQAEIGDAENKKAALSAEKDGLQMKRKSLENETAHLENDIRTYKQFFNSEDCKKKERTIEHYKRVIALYEDGVNRLFRFPQPVEHIKQLEQELYQRRANLERQLLDLQNMLNCLSTDYINIINRIEREVNFNAV